MATENACLVPKGIPTANDCNFNFHCQLRFPEAFFNQSADLGLDSFAVGLAQAHKPKSYFDVAPKLYEANPPPGTYDAKGLEIAMILLMKSTISIYTKRQLWAG